MKKFLLAVGAMCLVIVVLEFVLPGLKYKLRRNLTKMRLSTLPANEYIVVNDILARTSAGKINIDYTVVSRYGIFVIQEKPCGGRIFGKVDGDKWTRISWGKEHSFRNPLGKTKLQLAYLKSVLDARVSDFIPVVLFSGGGSSWVETSVHVIPGYSLKKTIRSYTTPRLDINTMQDYAIKLSELSLKRK